MVDDRIVAPEVVDLIVDAGRVMYGQHFNAGLCRLLGVNERRVRAWLHGKGEIEEKHLQRLRQALDLFYRHEEGADEVVNRLDAYLARQR